jgi:OPT family small oligopeptide transporter
MLEAKEFAAALTLEEVRVMMQRVFKLHEKDPNFPLSIIYKIRDFLGKYRVSVRESASPRRRTIESAGMAGRMGANANLYGPDNEDIFENPEKHEHIIQEMKLEAALITNNSPYAEVRAVVDNHDDTTTPCSTIRAWAIGLAFSVLLAFINQLFSVRQPAITVMANVAQLLAYPIGKACDSFLPDWGFTVFGTRHSLNPGPFTKKEHMLITIMANVAYNTPYTNYIIWIQFLPQYFGQSYAGNFGYQILIALSTNFIGYGMAGICRRFLVYPSYCVWPASLVTIALNSAFHNDKNTAVEGPGKRLWRLSRLKLFYIAFGAMFVYFWFPNFLFGALSIFSWMTWIAPDNLNLSTITGFNNGLGINPWPTFDWNVLLFDNTDPLMIPFFSTFNKFLGAFFSMFVILGLWYNNTYNTAYLPINSNRVFDHFGKLYNVSRAVDKHGLFAAEKYEAYSPPFLTAANITIYMFFFAIYSATLMYAILYHRHEIGMGFKALINSFRKNGDAEAGQVLDVHNRLMKAYPEVPEWWYMICLVAAIAFGIAGIASWETYTSPGVVFYGLLLCIIFVIPVGIIKAMTGIEVTLNVLAEFIGGSIVEGNALAMNYFKSFGYVTCAHAVWFTNDLKLAHYVKIPPRHTFWAQMIATLISTFVCVGVLNFQMTGIEGVCTPQAKFRLTCPGVNTFFTASVLWGTVGPKKVWGAGGQYTETLVGFPLGAAVVLIFYYAGNWFPRQTWIRSIHPVAIMYGGIIWAPYNMSYVWPAVPIAWFSWVYLKGRFLGFWSKVCFPLCHSLLSFLLSPDGCVCRRGSNACG